MQYVSAEHNYQEWLQLRKELYHDLSDRFHETEMELIVGDVSRESYLISDADTIIGMVELSLRNYVDGCIGQPVAYLEGIYIKPKYRGSGHSKFVIEWVKEWGKKKGCKELASDAELQNLLAQKFHQSMGFRETYRIVEYVMNIE